MTSFLSLSPSGVVSFTLAFLAKAAECSYEEHFEIIRKYVSSSIFSLFLAVLSIFFAVEDSKRFYSYCSTENDQRCACSSQSRRCPGDRQDSYERI
jgi:hypothetical protein